MREVTGFAVHVSPTAQHDPQLADFLLALEVHLADVLRSFPIGARIQLQRIPIFLTERTRSLPTFHPDEAWLREHAIDTNLARAIEVPSIELALRDLRDGDAVRFATLIAAGYFVRLATPPWAEAQAAFDAAKKANRATAAIAQDGVSYFAQMSAAYFGRATPPDRSVLHARDPEGYAFVARQWPSDSPPAKPAESDVQIRLSHGFSIWIEKLALGHAETVTALAFIDDKLALVATNVPAKALAVLRTFPIVVRFAKTHDEHPELWFHDAFVDIPDIAAMLAARTSSPNAIVHELGHAFAHAHPELRSRTEEAYHHARDAHLYDNVEHAGRYGRSYAATNAAEYFAELSKTFITSAAEWYPHTRAELAKYDPVGYRLMADAWSD